MTVSQHPGQASPPTMRGGSKSKLIPSLLGLAHLVLIVALTHGGGKNTRLNWLFFLPIAFICIHMIFFSISEDSTADYSLSMAVSSFFFMASEFILLKGRQQEPRMVGQVKPTSEMSLSERLIWSTKLVATPRGIGWTHEAPHIPSKSTSSRTKFIASQLPWILFYFILYDVSTIFILQNPCFATGGPSLTAYGWVWRTTAWMHVTSTWSVASAMYAVCSIVAVSVRLTEPRDWPHLFGSPREAYTVRKSWGRVWHQLLRELLTSHVNVVARALRLPKSTFTTYFKLFGCFFISGVIHYCGDYMLFQDWSGTSIRFFLLQAVAITFEDSVIALAAQLGYNNSNPFFKIVGFAWVFGWFTYSLPIWLDATIHAGIFDDGVDVSLIMGLWKGDWFPKRIAPS